MTAKSLLAPHWMREHPDRQDLPHIEAMQYKSVKLFLPAWSDAGFSRDLLTVLPKDSYILARDHALSEQKEDMWRDPVAAGNNHAQQWINKVHSGEYHLPTDRSFFLGINEPDATNGDRSKIDLYNESFLDRLAVNGLRGGAFNFSTGHPRTVDGTPNTPADYSVFERSHQAIVRGNHIGVLHIYGTGAVPCAPGHYDRLKACTWQDVEWVVGEFGVDEYVIGGQEHVGYQKYFNGRLNDYCQWLDTAIMGINDPRIHSFQMFTYDFAHPWSSFDVHPIRAALESYQWQHMAHIDSQPSTIHVPAISTGPAEPTPSAPQGAKIETLYVTAPAGLRLRSQPNVDSDSVTSAPYGAEIDSYGPSDDGKWWQVVYNGQSGWMYRNFLSSEKPQVEPTQPPPSDTFERTINFILGVEGGYTANDEGNPANFGINQGANPDLDVAHITKEQAIERYRTGYWQASGADKLDWPFCLLVMDAAVQHGPDEAKELLGESDGSMWRFQGLRQQFYAQIKQDSWDRNGKAWMKRMGDLLVEVSK